LNTSDVAAKAAQLRLPRQRVVMVVQKAQANVLLYRLNYALPGWEGAERRRDAQAEFHEAAPGEGVGGRPPALPWRLRC
jgi:hypothetical protein